MEFSTQMMPRILEKAELYACTPQICPCRMFHTVLIDEWTIVSMAPSHVTLNVVLTTTGSDVDAMHNGVSLLPQRCAHDLSKTCLARVTMSQWTHVVSKVRRFIMIAARYRTPGMLDATGDFAGVVPHAAERRQEADDGFSCVELFSGAFSGWSQIVDRLPEIGIPCHMKLALDLSDDCATCHSKSFDIPASAKMGPWYFEWLHDDLPSRIFIESDIRSFKWTHMLGTNLVHLCFASPPCQPWSKANHGPGLFADDGTLMLDVIGLMKLLQPKAVGLEMVSGITSHAHFRQVRDFLRFAGYHIRWSSVLNLKDILPQNRERLLLIAVRGGDTDIFPHSCIPWPAHPAHSLHTAEILMELSALPPEWKDATAIDLATLELYLRNDLMPKSQTDLGPPLAKRSKMDVLAYRIRYPQDIFGCIMASYSSAHSLPQHLLKSHGLFGCMVMDETKLRFLAIPELAALNGIMHKLFFMGTNESIIRMIGNCISTPHAAITILNMIGFLDPNFREADIRVAFDKLLALRFHAGNLRVQTRPEGWFLYKADDEIPATMPMHDFVSLRLIHDAVEIRVQCERGIDLWSALHVLMHTHPPSVISFKPFRDAPLLLEIPKPFLLLSNQVILHVNRPLVLHLHPSVQTSPEVLVTPCAVVVCVEGIFILHAGQVNSIQHAVDIVADQFEHFHGTPTNQFCIPLVDTDHAPYHFMLMPVTLSTFDFVTLETFKVSTVGGGLTLASTDAYMNDLVQSLRDSGLLQIIRTFGWHFVMQVPDTDQQEMKVLQLVPIPGSLALSPSDAKHCLMTLIFLAQLVDTHQLGCDPYLQVELKLLGVTAWKGQMGTQMACSWFERTWNRTCQMFNVQGELRFLIGGRQVNPGWPLSDYLTDSMRQHEVCRIHTVLQLQGGGPVKLTPNPETIIADRAAEPSGGVPLDRTIDLFYLAEHHYSDAVSQVIKDWCMLPGQQKTMDTTRFLPLSFSQDDHVMMWESDFSLLLEFISCLKEVGAELILDKMGWILTVHFVAFENPPLARIILLPHPSGRSVCKALVQRFLQVVLFRFALPKPGSVPHDSCRVRVRAEGCTLYNCVLAANSRCSDITDAWEQASTLLAMPSVMRMVVNGRQASPEYLLSEYARSGPTGELYAHVSMIHPTAGGGPADSQAKPPSDTKNMLATFLLTAGADMREIVPFIDSLAKAGPAALAAILQAKDKPTRLQMLKKLADSMQLTIPDLQFRHQKVKKKVQEKMPHPHDIDFSALRVKQGFFLNQDGSVCEQRSTPAPGAAGIALSAPKDALKWIKQTLSADEQALVVIGSCLCDDASLCQPVQLPAFYQDEPVLFNACLHQLGKKHVKVEKIVGPTIPTANTCVLSVTTFRDELTEQMWQQLLQAPVKTTLALLFAEVDQPALVGPPWGRSFQNGNGRNVKHDAATFQFHCRVDQPDLKTMMRASGKGGVYTTPKTEDKKVDQNFQVIWMQLDPVQVTVVASTMERSLGIVRNTRLISKANRGIRFDKADFPKAFAELKPGDEMPSQVSSKFLFKLAPVPIGAKISDVQAWLKSNSWPAKPIRALAAGTWLCGSEEKFDSSFSQWNQQTLLVTWIHTKNDRQPWLLAGPTNQFKTTSKTKHEVASLPPLTIDPWNNYKPIDFSAKPSVPLPPAVSRKVEAPIEDRFASQQRDIEKVRDDATKELNLVRDQMKELQTHMQEARSSMDQHQKNVQDEFKAVRAETQKQFHDMNTTFQETLNTALTKQDRAISTQLTELKLLLTGRPNAAKKAKVSKPGETEVQDVDDEDERL